MIGNKPAYLSTATRNGFMDDFAGGLGAARPPYISLDQDRFTLIDASGQKVAPAALSIDVIFVGSNPTASRIYYERGSYDRADTTPPICFSDNGVGPSENSLTPQAGTCGACPRNVWDQVNIETGNKTPACSSKKKVACLVAGKGEQVYLLAIPAKSLRGTWKPYLVELQSGGADPCDVVTRLTIEDKMVRFEMVGWVPEKIAPLVDKAVKGDDWQLVVNAHDRVKQRALPAPAPERPALNQEQTNYHQPSMFAETKIELPASIPVAATPETPKRGRPRTVRPNETLVPSGPIASGTFIGKTESPPTPAFGVAPTEQVENDMEALLAKAFGGGA